MTREQMIYACRQKLPYPVSFYDDKKDSAVWSIYYKHIVCGIPIDKKHRKAKASNNQARQAELEEVKQAQQPPYRQLSLFDQPVDRMRPEDKPVSMTDYAIACLNRGEINSITIFIYGEQVCETIVENGLTVEDYYEALYGDHEPTIFYREQDGCYYRKGDCGSYMLIPDEEMQYIDLSEHVVGMIESEQPPEKQISLQKKLGR